MPGWLWVVIAVVLGLLIYLSLRRRGGTGRNRGAPAIEYLPDEDRSREGPVDSEGHVEREIREGDDQEAPRQEIPEDPSVGAPSGVESRPPVHAEQPPAEEPQPGHGAGSPAPGAAGNGPQGWTVKGNADSMLFYTADAPSYLRSAADVWFESEEAATAAGFTRWNAHHR